MKNTNYCGTMSAEVKRVSLKPCTSSASSSVPLDKKKPKDPKTSKEPKSNRFVLELNPENDECNEFSFSDLMKSLDNNAESYNVDPLDPLATNEDEQCLKDLEKHFQQKYGPKKRKRMEDYIDKGLGYDETDPFIDNDEAYDELVPSTLTTQYGGFYINCGELEFRPLSPDKEVDDDEDEDNIRPVVKRKRKMQLISSKRRPSHDLKNKKVKIQIPQGKTVAQMIQQKKIIKPMANEDNDNIEEIEINDSNSNEPVVSTSVCDVIDSVAKGEDEPNGEERNPSNGSSEADDLKKDGSPISLKLPEGLPNDLNILIERIKRLAYTTHDGKRNFFNDEVNQILFEIERRCRSLAYTNRTQVYSHLSAHLPCTKQTLMSRAKKISTEAFDYELQTALSNIRVIIDVSKTRVFANYQKMMDEAKLKFENNGHNGVESSPIQVPKKIFPFDKQLRKELKSALTAKINLYDQIGAKSHAISLKDYLHDFLDKEIKPIFPKGWMTLEVLKHRSKWIEQILPAEPKQLPSSSQSGPQSTSQSVQPSAQTNHISPQSQVNKVQNQHSPQEKVYKPPMTNPKLEIDSSPNNVTPKLKSVINSHQMANKMSDSLSEGLGTKFIPSNKNTAINSNTSEPINLTSIDLSTKPRSSPKPLNVTPSSMTPMNLSHEGCLTKLIEQSLADYPNSSVSSTSNQRNTKTSSLPQTQLPFNEMFAKSFDSNPKKASSPEIIEIASSPEPYPKPATTRVQPNMVSKPIPHSTPQQLSQQKAAVSSSSMNYMRNSDASKKKYTSSGATSLLHSSSKMDQMMRQISSTPIRSTASDTLLTITPVQSKSNDNSVSSSKQSVSQTSSVITSSVTSPTFPFDQHDSAYMEQYVRYLQSVNSNAINLLHQNPMRYMESSPLFTNRNSQNLYFPYTTNTSSTSHRTGNKDK